MPTAAPLRLTLLLTLFLLCLTGAGVVSAAPMAAWYSFDTSPVGQSVGRTPWPAYPLATTVGEGRVGKGLVLPGVGCNGLYLPNPVAFWGPEAAAGTIALWVKPAFDPAQEQGQRAIVDLMAPAGNSYMDGYEVIINTDKDGLMARPSTSPSARIPTPLKLGQWTHLALAWDSTTGMALYVDGVKVKEVAAPFKPIKLQAGWPGRVGCHTVGGGFPFAGTIDELRVFNYRLTDVDAAQLPGLSSVPPKLSVTGEWTGELSFKNLEAEPVNAVLQGWGPGPDVDPPYWGYLPFPFGMAPPEAVYWTAGPTHYAEQATPLTLAPGGTGKISVPGEPGYLRPQGFRVMVGEGLAQRQAAGRIFPGLRVDVDRFAPVVVYADRKVELPVRVSNGLGRNYTGEVEAELKDASGAVLTSARLPLRLADDATAKVALALAVKLAPGKYTLAFSATTAGGQRMVVNVVPVYATKNETLATICDISATSRDRSDAMLARMKADGVAVLQGGAGTYSTHVSALEQTLAQGFQTWRSAVASGSEVCENPAKREAVRVRAKNLGALLRDNPAVLFQVIAGEGLNAPPCYCADCTKSFQSYLQKTFGSLEALNKTWGAHYRAWAEVRQLGSPEDVDETAERLKNMKVALELPKENTARWQKLFALDRPRAIEWKRWHEGVLRDWYAGYVAAFNATNGGRTPIGEQPCWPNFKTHMLFALGEFATGGGMDLYLPGELPATLGYASELMLNFDMNASIFHAKGRPLMVNELYVQDLSPALLPEAQGWWLTGRGYGLNDYFMYDYYKEGTRGKLPLIFALLDPENKPYPTYDSFCRFSRDLKVFNQQYGFATLRREEPRVALYMSDDTSLANELETGGATWGATGVLGHVGAYWLTERAGFPVEFVNDAGLSRLAGQQVLVVPWTHVARAESLRKVLEFARGGGTVILDGPVGLFDEHYQPYAVLPGGETLSGALGISFSAYQDSPNRLVTDENVGPPKRSAWFRFDAETLGKSLGVDWPAQVKAATAGPGKVGGGLILGGEPGNGLALPDPAGFFGATAERGTVALWVKPDFDPQAKGQRVIANFMVKAGNTLIDGYEVVMHTDGGQLVARASLFQDVMKIPSPLKQGEWTHLALAWDCRLGSSLYVNGKEAARHGGGFTPIALQADWPGRIGSHTPGGGYPFTGALDEVRLFNYQLSAAEAAKLPGDVDPQAPQVIATGNQGAAFGCIGAATDLRVTKGTVLRRDISGQPALVEVPVGKGKVLALLTNLGRSNRSRQPDPDALKLWRSLLEDRAGLATRYRFVPKAAVATDTTENLDHGGAGLPDTAGLFDVGVRIKDNREAFLFLVSFFAPAEGTLELSLPAGEYTATDALTGAAVPLTVVGGKTQMAVSLPAFGTRVVRLTPKAAGPVFAGW